MLRRLAALTLILSLAWPLACGGDDFTPAAPKPPCNEDPWSCPKGQTCWLNGDGSKFSCLNQGSGKIGDACELRDGEPTCAAGLFCYSTQSMMSPPVCTPYCEPTDPEHACPDNHACDTLGGQGQIQVQVCRP